MESIYRKVSIRMWSDAKFRALSPLPPSGQSLWLVIMAGEQTEIIPGIFKIGETAWAENLGWSTEAFREAFREASEQGLVKADWDARLVWVPNALRHNKPASPNVIKGWFHAWDLLPECDLKLEAWQSFKGFIEGLGKTWLEAFNEACRKPSGKVSAKAMANQAVGSRQQATGILDLKSVLDEPREASSKPAQEKPHTPQTDLPDISPSLLEKVRYRLNYDTGAFHGFGGAMLDAVLAGVRDVPVRQIEDGLERFIETGKTNVNPAYIRTLIKQKAKAGQTGIRSQQSATSGVPGVEETAKRIAIEKAEWDRNKQTPEQALKRKADIEALTKKLGDKTKLEVPRG